MPTEPTPKYYEIIGPGNDDIRNLTKVGHAFGGPQAVELAQWDFGTTLGNEWSVKRLVFGYEGSTADNMYLWLADHTSDVGSTVDAENFFDGNGNWAFRMRVSKSYISGFTASEIAASPWVDIVYGAAPASPNNLKSLILAQTAQGGNTGGNNNGAQLLVAANNYTNLHLTNTYIYIAAKPDLSALPGQHVNWGFRQKYVYP